MYYMYIYDYEKDKEWKEVFDSYYLFRKRVTKLNFSKKLVITRMSNLEE